MLRPKAMSDGEQEDRNAILSRRNRLIALALSGLLHASCDSSSMDPPKTPEAKAEVSEASGVGALPESEHVEPVTPTVTAEPLELRAPRQRHRAGSQPTPMPCLSVAPGSPRSPHRPPGARLTSPHVFDEPARGGEPDQ